MNMDSWPSGISAITLFVEDLPVTRQFYRDVFGWDIHVQSDVPEFRYTTLGTGESMKAGIMDASAWLPEGSPATWSVYFRVEHTDTALAKVVEQGGTMVTAAEDTPYGRLATAADPMGATFKFVGSS
jgi:predicted enzyme related to lactoylglutathione lyase